MLNSSVRQFGEGYESLRVMDAREVLRQDVVDLQVPDGANWTISPSNLGDHMYGVPIKSVEDLQLLGHVPRGIEPGALLKAVQMDDEVTDERMSRSAPPPVRSGCSGGCGCNGGCAGGQPSADEVYRAARLAYHPNLAQLLSNHWGVRLVSNDVSVKLAHKWLRSIGMVTIVNLFRDIAIGRDAVLTVDRKSRSLYAHNILIARTGTLLYRGGYLKVWANAVDRWDPAWINITAAQIPKWMVETPSPWLLER